MSEHSYTRSILIAAPVELTRRFFADGEAWYRLNPEWEVLSLDRNASEQYLKVRYERSEAEAEYRRSTSAEFPATGGAIVLHGLPERTITLTLSPYGTARTRLDWYENFSEPIETARRAELGLWIDAVAGYLKFAARSDRRARLAHWLLDRFWLRMSPTARRVGLLIIGMEALALLLFIAIVIVYRLMG